MRRKGFDAWDVGITLMGMALIAYLSSDLEKDRKLINSEDMDVFDLLASKLRSSVEKEEYESAAKIRDQISALKKLEL